MKNYILFLSICMYTTVFFAADHKHSKNIHELNKLLAQAVKANDVPVVKSLLAANADPFYVCNHPGDCFTTNPEIQNILEKAITGK